MKFALTIVAATALFVTSLAQQPNKGYLEEIARDYLRKSWSLGKEKKVGTDEDTFKAVEDLIIPQLKKETDDEWRQRKFGLVDLAHGLVQTARSAKATDMPPIFELREATEKDTPPWKNSFVWICHIEPKGGGPIVRIKWVIHLGKTEGKAPQWKVLGVSRIPLPAQAGNFLYTKAMRKSKGFLRNFVFGAEDSLVSTVGLLSGVSFAGFNSDAIILSGLILILVEAISMGAGVYISEDSTNELTPNVRENQVTDSLVMLFSYLLIGFIPLLPYVAFADTRHAFYWSIIFSLLTLFAVGLFKGYFVHKRPLFGAIKITAIGAVVIAVAVLVGTMVQP